MLLAGQSTSETLDLTKNVSPLRFSTAKTSTTIYWKSDAFWHVIAASSCETREPNSTNFPKRTRGVLPVDPTTNSIHLIRWNTCEFIRRRPSQRHKILRNRIPKLLPAARQVYDRYRSL